MMDTEKVQMVHSYPELVCKEKKQKSKNQARLLRKKLLFPLC